MCEGVCSCDSLEGIKIQAAWLSMTHQPYCPIIAIREQGFRSRSKCNIKRGQLTRGMKTTAEPRAHCMSFPPEPPP